MGIATPRSTSSGTPSAVSSPLHMLSRGYLGEEMANLVNFLMVHKSELYSVAERWKQAVNWSRKTVEDIVTRVQHQSRVMDECAQSLLTSWSKLIHLSEYHAL